MSSKESPYYAWDQSSPGWLLRKFEEGEPISRAEVVRVIKANPDLQLDPVLQKLVMGAISGTLKGTRGRKPKPGTAAKEYAAIELYHYYLARIKEMRKRSKERGYKRPQSDMSTTELAHALVARALGYKNEAVVRNLISKVKNRAIRVRYNPDDL